MSSYLGVDIGSQGVKVIQLENDRGHGRLVTYGYEVVPTPRVLSDVTKREEQEIIAALRSVLARSRTTTTKAIGALPTFSVFSSLLTLPKLSEKELAETIRWEAKKVIPLPIEEMILDSKVIKTWKSSETVSAPGTLPSGAGVIEQKKEETLHVFLTAAPKKLVERTMNIFRGVGLELLSLETEIFALGRSLLWNDVAPVMVVDIGASTTTMAVVIDQIPVLSRSIEFGGAKLTTSIATQLHISIHEAEIVKQDLLSGKTVSTDALTLHCAPLVNELIYLVEQYKRSDLTGFGETRKIEKIVLTGGGAQFSGLATLLTAKLNINALVQDPWARVAYPVELKPVLDTLAGSFAIPIGLALREIEVKL
ncbi:pilus assembly protein PilM [Candidatus Uhrbacteria bacterium]|nr:pilus assembly protein PilM [Candidatus Uhrbacteria bacterium]